MSDREPTEMVCQFWTESERGWGQRPDGYSLHQSLGDAERFAKGYAEQFHTSKFAPDCYSFPNGTKTVYVPQEVSWEDYDAVVAKDHDDTGRWRWESLGCWFTEWSPESRMKQKAKK